MTAESSLFIRLFIDEDVHKRLAHILRLRSYDVTSVDEAGRVGMSDEEQLRYAVDTGRTLFTFNAVDYIQLHIEWMQEHRSHCGIVVARQLSIGETSRRLLRLLNSVTADEMQNQLRWLQ